jgi:pyruvate-formate lyase-activating enzyme
MVKKIFPISTATSCQLKWNWSTIYLGSGFTRSCHRTSESKLTVENFKDFHNTPLKVADRQSMLKGEWPTNSCGYCKSIEANSGISDRIRHLTIDHPVPEELFVDSTSTHVSPTILEIYFNNTCNLGCLYCHSTLSSAIEAENKKFGEFKKGDVEIKVEKVHYKDLIDSFWEWFPEGFPKVKKFHVLGGEPFYQKELAYLIEYIDKYPNKDCILTLVTNLMVSKDKLKFYIDKFKQLLKQKKLKRVDILCSIDCWGQEQEYVRWGINCKQWEENFLYLLSNKWIYLSINQTITPLTIKSMPMLLEKLIEWRKIRYVGHWFSAAEPCDPWMKAGIFGKEEFYTDAEKILKLMPQITDEDKVAYKYMDGIFKEILSNEINHRQIENLITYLDEKDRRRNTNWKQIFPWLIKYKKNVV